MNYTGSGLYGYPAKPRPKCINHLRRRRRTLTLWPECMLGTEHFGLIENLPKANPTTGISVRSALQETQLFTFMNCLVEQIGT
jgi:hypothetical protein